MDPTIGEYFKLKNWVDTFMRIPFNNYIPLPIKYSDGIEQVNTYMENSVNILNKAVYGLDDAKIQIMQLIQMVYLKFYLYLLLLVLFYLYP